MSLYAPRAGDCCMRRTFFEAMHGEIKMAEKFKYSMKKIKVMMLLCQPKYITKSCMYIFPTKVGKDSVKIT